jgi:hypothetical protein
MNFDSNDETVYLAVIGDVRGSRQSLDRASVQERLEKGLEQVNREGESALAAAFAITLGDEFQGLLRRAETAIEILVSLEIALPGIPIRYGLGWGGLTTHLRERAIGMDGPCFHAARLALSRGKKANRWVTVCGFGEEEDGILNGLFGLLGGVRSRWKRKQAETVSLRRRARYQKDVARQRGVVDSVVSDTLRAALYGPVTDAEEAMTHLLARFATGRAVPSSTGDTGEGGQP